MRALSPALFFATLEVNGVRRGEPVVAPPSYVPRRVYVRPNLPAHAGNDHVQESWDAFGLSRPNISYYRIPSLPPLANPALAARSHSSNFFTPLQLGVPKLIYYNPADGPPPAGAFPLTPPIDSVPSTIPTQFNIQGVSVHPVPLASSYTNGVPQAPQLRPRSSPTQGAVGTTSTVAPHGAPPGFSSIHGPVGLPPSIPK